MKKKKEKKEICHKSEDKQNAQYSTAWTILLLLFIVEAIKDLIKMLFHRAAINK